MRNGRQDTIAGLVTKSTALRDETACRRFLPAPKASRCQRRENQSRPHHHNNEKRGNHKTPLPNQHSSRLLCPEIGPNQPAPPPPRAQPKQNKTKNTHAVTTLSFCKCQRPAPRSRDGMYMWCGFCALHVSSYVCARCVSALCVCVLFARVCTRCAFLFHGVGVWVSGPMEARSKGGEEEAPPSVPKVGGDSVKTHRSGCQRVRCSLTSLSPQQTPTSHLKFFNNHSTK